MIQINYEGFDTAEEMLKEEKRGGGMGTFLRGKPEQRPEEGKPSGLEQTEIRLNIP